MRSKVICPVQPAFSFMMKFIGDKSNNFYVMFSKCLCLAHRDNRLLPPHWSAFHDMPLFTVLQPHWVSTREGINTWRLSLLQNTLQNLEKWRKNSKDQNLSSFWDMRRWRYCLTDGAHNFQVQENSGSEKPSTPSSLSLELYVKETPGIVWDQRRHRA